MRFNVILFLLIFISGNIFSQELKKSTSIYIKPPMETENFSRMISHKESNYLLRKIKSIEITNKQFELTKYDKDLETVWERKIKLDQFQNILSFINLNGHLQLFVETFDLDNKVAVLELRQYDLKSGKQTLKKELMHTTVGNWLKNYEKAYVAQTFKSAIDSKQNENSVTPLEYRHHIEYSNDSSNVVVYMYDYSSGKLLINAVICKEEFKTIKPIQLGVDANHVSYGLKVDNYGELYLLKVSLKGQLAVIKVNPETLKSSYLAIPVGSTAKINPVLHIHKSHQAYLAYHNVKEGRLKSISVCLLDFDKEKVDDNHLLRFTSSDFKQMNEKVTDGEKYFEPSDIIEIDNKLIIILEQHKLEGKSIHYNPIDVENLETWHEGNATVTTSNMVVLVFDKDLNPLKKIFIVKDQKSNIIDGMNTMGHKYYVNNHSLFLVYSTSSNRITNDLLKVQELDLKELKLNEKMSSKLSSGQVPLLTALGFNSEKQLTVIGRKGLLGKKNYINKYEF